MLQLVTASSLIPETFRFLNHQSTTAPNYKIVVNCFKFSSFLIFYFVLAEPTQVTMNVDSPSWVHDTVGAFFLVTAEYDRVKPHFVS